MGNLTADALVWDRPEDLSEPRPYYLVNATGSSDLGGAIVGALASAALVFQASDPAYFRTLMAAALAVYESATLTPTRHGAVPWLKPTDKALHAISTSCILRSCTGQD